MEDKGICSKVNVITWLEFELAYYNSAVCRFNHYTMRTLLTWRLDRNTEIGEFTKKRDKTNKNSIRLQLQGEIEEIRINYFPREKNEN